MKISGYRLDEIMAERRHIGPVCAAAQGLYAELCRQYNKFPDPAGFECTNGFLMVAMGNCDEKSIVKWRGQLETAGMINFISRGKEKKPGIYQMLNISITESTTGKFPVDNTPTTGIFPVDSNPTTGNIPVVEGETDCTTTGKFPVALPEIFLPTLNKSKLVSTNVLTRSPKKEGEEKKEDSSFAETSFPKIPTVTDPFEAFELPPAAPPFCAAPPQAEMPAENPTAAPAKTKRQPSPKFQKPTHQQLEAYFQDRRQEWSAATCKDEAETFFDHYTSNGWKVGTAKTPMQDWQAAVRNWLKRTFSNARSHNNPTQPGKATGNSKTGAAATPRKGGGTIEELQALKRCRPANTPERTEFTPATVVE